LPDDTSVVLAIPFLRADPQLPWLADVLDPDVVYKNLKHLELPTASPPLLPDCCVVEEFEQCFYLCAADDSQYADHVRPGHNRFQQAPPGRIWYYRPPVSVE
jgi:hypothetical protein